MTQSLFDFIDDTNIQAAITAPKATIAPIVEVQEEPTVLATTPPQALHMPSFDEEDMSFDNIDSTAVLSDKEIAELEAFDYDC